MDFKSNDKNYRVDRTHPFINDIHSIDNNELNNVPLGFFIGYVFNYYSTFFNECVRDINLTQKQIYILVTLFHENNLSQERLASLLYISEATITREVNYLERENLIVRKKDENDGRKKVVSLSEKGMEIFEMFEKIDHESEMKFKQYFSDEEFFILKFLLKKAILTLENIIED